MRTRSRLRIACCVEEFGGVRLRSALVAFARLIGKNFQVTGSQCPKSPGLGLSSLSGFARYLFLEKFKMQKIHAEARRGKGEFTIGYFREGSQVNCHRQADLLSRNLDFPFLGEKYL